MRLTRLSLLVVVLAAASSASAEAQPSPTLLEQTAPAEPPNTPGLPPPLAVPATTLAEPAQPDLMPAPAGTAPARSEDLVDMNRLADALISVGGRLNVLEERLNRLDLTAQNGPLETLEREIRLLNGEVEALKARLEERRKKEEVPTSSSGVEPNQNPSPPPETPDPAPTPPQPAPYAPAPTSWQVRTEHGLAGLYRSDEAEAYRPTMPEKSACQEVGTWLRGAGVETRKAEFFVRAGDRLERCVESDGGTWGVVRDVGGRTAHVIQRKE